ncbi:MAG: DUF4278 domain-containing protein [Thermosynechococcaceae cyanobacterium]
MQLTYRGVNYEYTPPQVETKATGAVGKYRGLDWRFRNTARAAVQQPTLDLVYRGVPYQTGQSEAIATPARPVSVPAYAASNPVKDMARTLMISHHALIKHRQQSMLGRVATEVGLSTNASHYWSHI